LAEQTAIGVRALAEAMPEIAQEGPAPSPATATPPPEERSSTPARAVSERPTREEFLAVYEASGRNVRATSKHFGRDRRQVYRWLEAFGIER
jgi:transcriptional regulator of acetoin/glycerol metabolism